MADRVRSVERALLMLEEIAASDSPLGVSEISRRAGVNRATAWRLLNTLEHFDLVQQNPDTRRYTVSYGTVRLAICADPTSLIRHAHPVLERVAAETNGTAFLEVASQGRLHVIDQASPDGPILVELSGLHVPLNCGSVGKLYLASLRPSELEQYLASPLAQPTPYTISDPDALRAHLAECRRTGVAVNYKEHHEDWCGITVAVRDRAGRPLAYLNVTLPTFRWTLEALWTLEGPLKDAAAEIERWLRVRDTVKSCGLAA